MSWQSDSMRAGQPANWRTALVAFGYLAVGLVAGYSLANSKLLPKNRTTAAVAEKGEWFRVKEREPVLAVEAPLFAGRHQQQAGHATSDGGRSNWVTIGTIADAEPFAALNITRRTTPHTLHKSLIENLNEQLPMLRSAQRNFGGNYYLLKTKYGEHRGVNLMVNADGVRKYCLGFHTTGRRQLSLMGIVCSQESTDVTPDAVACLLNTMRYTRQKDEQALRQLLDPVRGTECGATALGQNNPLERSKYNPNSL